MTEQVCRLATLKKFAGETTRRHAVILIEAMTEEAPVRKDWANVVFERNLSHGQTAEEKCGDVQKDKLLEFKARHGGLL